MNLSQKNDMLRSLISDALYSMATDTYGEQELVAAEIKKKLIENELLTPTAALRTGG